MKDLARQVRDFAELLRRDYASEIARNPKHFKVSVIHFIRLNLPPGPGRPSHKDITRALEMRRQGREWREIYPVCIAKRLKGAARQLAQIHLRDACRARRNSRGRRKTQKNYSTRKMPRPIVSSGHPVPHSLPSEP